MRQTTIKSDLVIAMTIAEIFLLILFVVWYAQGPEPGPDVQALEKENRELRAEVAKQRDKIAEYEREHDWWVKNFGQKPPASVDDMIDVLRSPAGAGIREELARGLPSCERDKNILADVIVSNGITQLRLTPAANGFVEWAVAAGQHVPRPGQLTTDHSQVDAFLRAVDSYYANRVRDRKKACRFDYRLIYSTAEDYYEARERFERSFYLASKRRGNSATSSLQ